MKLLTDFEQYLKDSGKSDKTISNYIGAFSFINKIIEKNNIPNLENWKASTLDSYIRKITEDETFISQNTKGNNMYSATINNLKKFMSQIKPILPFDTFGWRWASTGIASHLNQPTSLKVVLDALLINGNGQDNYTKPFKDLIYKLCINKYKISDAESDKLTKLSNPNDEKNIIENSANYWYHLGLLEDTGRNAKVSQLGERFLNGSLSNDEFLKDRIKNYYLPNKSYTTTEVSKWDSNNIKVYPLKLIQDIFKYLSKNYDEGNLYLTEEELSKIIIPCSSDLEKFDITIIVKHLIEFRKDSLNYSDWPLPQSNYTDDKGYRMANEFLYFLEVFDFLDSNKKSTVRSLDKKYKPTDKLLNTIKVEDDNQRFHSLANDEFDITIFQQSIEKAGLAYDKKLITRYISSLVTKPFVLLSGLSGSGKTKLAQAFTKWICQDDSQVCIVPVGADWTNREPLLGYPNALQPDNYVKPENCALDLIIQANQRPELPHFLILDEMNLSHVERYFADFLSVMESNEKIPLFSNENTIENIPSSIRLPSNLFIIGTVNIDETTYMFSPKVLDRANAIEFRVSKEEMTLFFDNRKEIDMTLLYTKGASMAKSFLKIAENKSFSEQELSNVNETLVKFFVQLKKAGAEFGYRSASEIIRLFNQLTIIDVTLTENEKIDIAIMQKLLPKLHGSRRKLCPILLTLAAFCTTSEIKHIEKEVFEVDDFNFSSTIHVKYPLSLEKISRMYNGAIDNGFASYAEA